MTGTVKQVEWANQIIAEKINTCNANIAHAEKMAAEHNGIQIFVDAVEHWNILKAVLENLFADPRMQDAALIIDRRNSLPDPIALLNQAGTIATNKGISKTEALKAICGIK